MPTRPVDTYGTAGRLPAARSRVHDVYARHPRRRLPNPGTVRCCRESAPRRLSRLLAAIAVGALSGFEAPASAEFEVPVAISGATIVIGDGPTIEEGVILIEHGRIVDAAANLDVPLNAEVIDAKGMVAYPGFVSAHGHLGIPETQRTEAERARLEDENPDVSQKALPATRRANRRGIHPQWRARDVYAPQKKEVEAFRRSGFTTVLAAPRGGLFGGTSALIDLTDAPLRRAVLATGVAQHASFEIGEPGQYPRSLIGVFAQFRQVLLDTRWWIEQRRFYKRHPRRAERPAADAALEALEPVTYGETPLIFVANTEHEINRALDLAKEFDLRIAISGAKEAYKVVDRLKDENVPLIVSLKFEEEPEYGKKKRDRRRSSGRHGDQKKEEQGEAAAQESAPGNAPEKPKRIYEPLKLRKERRRLWEEHVANVVKLHEAGLRFALSTREFKKPSELIDNVRLVIDRGLPVPVALAALTYTPASMFDVADQIGRIESGQLANIVLMTGPFEKSESKVKYVFVEGKKFEPKQADGQGEETRAKAAPEASPGGESRTPRDEAGAAQEEMAAAESGVAPGAGGSAPGDKDEQERDKGPTWRCEVERDRVPKHRTGGNVILQNATVITVSGPTLQRASVLIQGGKITAVGRDLPVPDGVTVIDATGRYIMPGMIDCHSHMGVDGNVNESSVAVSAEVRLADVVRNDSVGIYRALAGGVTTTHVMHGSANPIGGQNVVFKLKYKRPVQEMILHDAPRTIKFALGENVKQSNWATAYGKRFPNGRMGVESVIRDAFIAARRYEHAWQDFRARTAAGEDVLAPRRDLRLEALTDVLRGDLWVHCHCYRSDEILRLLAIAEDFGIRIAVLQHVLEGYRVAPEIARHGAGASTFANFWAYKIEAYGAIPYNAALMTEHGIVTSVNSDSPNTIRYLNVEAAKCIRWGGLDENEALRLVTLNPAIQLGIDSRVGSIDVGKDGDLAVFNGHPLNTFSRNVMTLIDGEVFFEQEDADPTVAAGPLDWNPSRHVLPPDPPHSLHRLYAIVGGTVHPISGPAIEHATVVIRNDRISAVGPDVEIPPGAGVVDASGLHVYPGLIDGAGNLGLSEIAMVRSTRDDFDIADFAPELDTASAIHAHSKHIRIARSGGITSQLARPTGGTISGRSAIINLDGWTADEMLVKDRVALHMSIPVLPARLTGPDKKERRETHEKAMRKLEDFLETAARYAAAKKAAEKDPDLTPEMDLRLEAMVPYVRGEKPVIFSASSYKAILDTIDFAEKHGFRPIISGGAEAWKLADTLKQKEIPVILGTVLSYPRGRFEAWDSVYRCASVLDRAGVSWCFASNSAAHAYNLGILAGMAVAHGLDPDRAMYGLTLGAARILGIDDELGSLEPGKMANVIVTTHPPTQAVSRVMYMFIRGRPVELTSMHTENYVKFKNRPAPVLPPEKELVGPPSLTRK